MVIYMVIYVIILTGVRPVASYKLWLWLPIHVYCTIVREQIIFLVDLVWLKFWDRIWEALASRITNLVLNSPGNHGNIVKKCIQIILNLYENPNTKNQTSEKRYKVPTTALPPMRDLGSLSAA